MEPFKGLILNRFCPANPDVSTHNMPRRWLLLITKNMAQGANCLWLASAPYRKLPQSDHAPQEPVFFFFNLGARSLSLSDSWGPKRHKTVSRNFTCSLFSVGFLPGMENHCNTHMGWFLDCPGTEDQHFYACKRRRKMCMREGREEGFGKILHLDAGSCKVQIKYGCITWQFSDGNTTLQTPGRATVSFHTNLEIAMVYNASIAPGWGSCPNQMQIWAPPTTCQKSLISTFTPLGMAPCCSPNFLLSLEELISHANKMCSSRVTANSTTLSATKWMTIHWVSSGNPAGGKLQRLPRCRTWQSSFPTATGPKGALPLLLSWASSLHIVNLLLLCSQAQIIPGESCENTLKS